jgi:signal transduction histidine kinase
MTLALGRSLPFLANVIAALLLLPIMILLPTPLNIAGFDLGGCNASLGILWNYLYLLELSAIVVLFGLAFGSFYKYVTQKLVVDKKNAILYFACFMFTLIFFGAEFVGDLTYVFEINLLGPAGMFIFLCSITYLIVKYKTFNIKLLATQALVFALIALVAAEFLFIDTGDTQIQVLIGMTLLGVTLGGFFLVRSVKKEVQQREEIEKLAKDLQVANDRLKSLDKMKSEFVSIASHQLRSPITAIRGYVSMLLEGSYGKFPDKAQEILMRVAESSKFMATSIEDYLNVSRIEAGNMKYEMSDFNLKEQAEKVADELRQVALKKGLVLVFRSDISGSGMVHADIGKTRQVIMNFIDNAIKYTPKGTVTVVAHDDVAQKKMWVTITDTGVGMDQETLSEVFDKFVRAKNANQINVTGTGLGLYVAKKMALGMGGRVWAESEGEGRGSTFHIEFPMLPGKASPV